jgi:hypothetical protein
VSELLDELARSMARSMPRRRALRMLGTAAVGVAFGGLARKSHATTTAHWCHEEVAKRGWKYCQQESEACFPACCPRERICSKGECGSNGCCQWSCCDPCNPRGSRPDGKGGCAPGPVSPDCGPKRCGPDITDALEDALTRVKSAFSGWSNVRRYDACIGLVTVPGAAVSWDIKELGPGGRESFTRQYPGCGTCGYSVQVGNDCHYAGSVNYAVYGVMMRLCHDHLSREDSSIADWFTQQEMLELVYIHKNLNWSLTQGANFQASNEWALAGYKTGSIRPFPPGDRQNCTERCKPYDGPGLTVRWLPNVIRPPR